MSLPIPLLSAALCVVLAVLLWVAKLRFRRLPESPIGSPLYQAVAPLTSVGLFLGLAMVPVFMSPPRPLQPVPFELHVLTALMLGVLGTGSVVLLSTSRQTLLKTVIITLLLSLSMLGHSGDSLAEAANAQAVQSSRVFTLEFKRLDEHRKNKGRSDFYLVGTSPQAAGEGPSAEQRLLITVGLYANLKRQANQASGSGLAEGRLLDVTENTGWLGMRYLSEVRLREGGQ